MTVAETLQVLERRAEQMNEVGFALSDRQLRRWLAGAVSSRDGARPANARVAEAEFGWPIDVLLAADYRPPERPGSRAYGAHPRQLSTAGFVSWVASHSSFGYEDAHRLVMDRADEMAATSPVARAALEHARHKIGRSEIADAVVEYYGDDARFHRLRVGGRIVKLSVLCEERWGSLAIPLGGGAEHCRLARRGDAGAVRLDHCQARAALERLAAAEVTETVLVNNPIFTLVGLEIGQGELAAEFGCVDFADYALGGDLLETELLDVLGHGRQIRAARATPLHDALLPSADVGLDFDNRLCAGGVCCLVAIADGDQYQLLVQERSEQVLNAPGTLAVIPQAFHQPLVDTWGETRISTTIERKLEDELFGRADLGQTRDMRQAAPLHPVNASPPMRWLRGHPDSWRIECTGFGINTVTGTYEFACLLVIHDPAWWPTHGHRVAANWEARRLWRYSSRDRDGLAHLIADPRWSNEGLFAFSQGVRRLVELDSPRVRAPAMERS
jgi:hypothetical protein